MALAISGCSANGQIEDLLGSSSSTISSNTNSLAVNSTNAAATVLSGKCDSEGSSIAISGSASSTTTCSGGSWSATVNLSSVPDGSVSFTVTQTTSSGESSSTTISGTKKTTIPTVAITTSSAVAVTAGNASSFAFAGTCSDNGAVILITSGSFSDSTFCSSGTWTKNLNLSSLADGTIALTAKHTDSVGNFATASQNHSKDALPPTVTLSSAATASTKNSPIPVTITFNESVTGFAVGDITVGNGTAGNFAGSGATYTVDITPTGQGAVTVDVAASVAQDAGGNNNTAATQLSRIYDNVAPTVTITSTAPEPTNTSPIPITITFSEAVTGFVVGDITVGNGTAGTFSGSGTTYTAVITPSGNGTVTVDVAGSVAQDAATNNNTAASQLTRTYNNAQPTVTITSAASNPTKNSPIPITITFSAAVTGFVVGDITVGNGTAGSFAGSGTTYTADITPTGQGTVTVDVAAAVAQDAATNNNQAAVQFTRVYDTVAPTVTLSSTATATTNTSPIPVTITFSESTSNFVIGDITVGNGTAGSFSGSGTTYTVDITPTGPGAVTVDVGAGVATDAATNNNTAATQLTRTYDTSQPTVAISSTASATTNVTPIPFTVTFNEAVTGFSAGDISSSNGLVQNFAGSGTTYTFDVPPTTDGAVNINIAGSVAQDAGGNNNTAATQYTRTYDTAKPTPVITATQTSPTNAGTINMTVTFNESVTNFVIGDITVANGTKGALSGSGTTYTFDITPTANTTVTVDIAAGVADDAAGNTSNAATQFSIVHDNTAPSITGLSNDATPTKSKTWNWGCSETCTYRFVVDTTSNTAPSGAYAATATATQASGTNTYYIHVEAKDAAGNTATVHHSAIIDNTAPTTPGSPADGTYLNSLTSSPNLSWTTSTDGNAVTSYEYAIGTTAGDNNVRDWTDNGTNLSVTASSLSLTTNTTYFMSVRAKDQAGNISNVAQANGWMADTTVPTDPSSVNDGTTNASITTSPTVTWAASTDTSGSGISYYEMAVGSTPGTADMKTWTSVGAGTSGSVGGMSLTSGTTYYASIRAVDNAGNISSVGQGDGWTALNPSSPDYSFKHNISLFHFDGANNATNNTFVDSSTNNFSITKFGNTTQGSSSPFSPMGWSGYFDGTGDYLKLAASSSWQFSGDFTVELWVKPSLSGAAPMPLGQSYSTNNFQLYINTNGSLEWGGFNMGIYTSAAGLIAANQWSHIAFTRDGTTARVYVNGIQAGSVTYAGTIGNNAELSIGARPDGAYPVTGSLADLRIVNGTSIYPSGTTFNPPSAPLTAVTNTVLLTLQSNRFKDNSSNDFAITRYGDTKIFNQSPYPLTTDYNPSTHGGSGFFDGTGDYLTIADHANVEMGSSDFTMEGWFYPGTQNTTYPPLITKWSGGRSYFITINPADNSLRTSHSTDGSTNIDMSSSANAWVPGQWNHFAYVRTGGNLYIYCNGNRVGTTTVSGSLYNGTGEVFIGSRGDGATYFTGNMTDVRIVKGTALYTAATYTVPTVPLTAVTNTQVLAKFANAGAYDSTTLTSLETLGNAKISTAQSKFGGSSFYSDGASGSYGILKNTNSMLTLGQTFTVEFWLYNLTSSPTGNVRIMAQTNNSTGLDMFFSGGNLNMNGGSTTSSWAPSANTWYHLALVMNAGTLSLYVNGTSVALGGTTTGLNYTSTNDLNILSYTGGGMELNSYIDDLRITKGRARYTANFTAPVSTFASTSPANFISATGGTVSIVGDYKIHKFTSSSTLTVSANAGSQTVEALVVAGGGGGGAGNSGGGGGAGGLLYDAAASASVGGISVTVGTGGAGGVSGTSTGANGGNSIFGSLTALGGGGGGSRSNSSSIYQGVAGGSGGGGGTTTGDGAICSGAAGTSGQGYAGGSGQHIGGNYEGAGGGGGAGGAGANNSGATAGTGGVGLSFSITGVATYYAGGGGASGNSSSAGGNGGGGNGGACGTGNAGTANTGGGGGGANCGGVGGAGGSGVVIIRYVYR